MTKTINLALLTILGILVAALFWSGLENLVTRWHLQPEYSHGFLIPLVSLYLLVERRQEILAHTQLRYWWGLPLCVLAILILFAGEISALYLFIHYALLLFLIGFAIIALGRKFTITLVPIMLLGFAVPLPYIIEVLVTAKMQLVSSSLGVAFIRFFNIPVYLSGNVIDLGEFKLHVVEACSGLRYLFPLLSVALITAYFYRAANWKRITIFLSAIPITIFMNSARIGITGLLVNAYGPSVAEGFLHDFEGWVIFIICLVVLLLEILLLERLTTRTPLASLFSVATRKVTKTNRTLTLSKPLTALTIILFASVAVLNIIDRRDDRVPITASLASFPLEIGPWLGERDVLDQSLVDGLDSTDYLLSNYRDSSGGKINLYIAYYENQRKGNSPHSPKVCIPGGGWEIAEFQRMELLDIPVNRVLIRQFDEQQLVYYWFVERGRVVANEYTKKWWLFRDILLENRSDGALVRIVAPIENSEDIAVAEERVLQFLRNAQTTILDYLPAPVNRKSTEIGQSALYNTEDTVLVSG